MSQQSPIAPSELFADGFRIRSARLSDAALLCAFKRRVLAETEYLLQGIEDFEDRSDVEAELIGRFLANDNCLLLVAVDGHAVVGMCTVVGGHLLRNRHVGQMGVAVIRRLWRRGLARRLIAASIAASRDALVLTKLALQVHASNTAARRLYESFDFEIEGVLRREARLGAGWDDLIAMGLLLDAAPAEPG